MAASGYRTEEVAPKFENEMQLASPPPIDGDICVLGGTFDPPTACHADIVKSLLQLGAAKVILVPGGPESNVDADAASIGFENKSNKSSFGVRFAWVKAMAARIEASSGRVGAVEVSNLEENSQLTTPKLVELLTSGGIAFERLVVVVGSDYAGNLHTWAGEDGKDTWMSTRFIVNTRYLEDTETVLAELKMHGWSVSKPDQIRVMSLQAQSGSSSDIRKKCNFLVDLHEELDSEQSPRRVNSLQDERSRRAKSLRGHLATGVWDEMGPDAVGNLAAVHRARKPVDAAASTASVRSFETAAVGRACPTLLTSNPGLESATLSQ